MDATAVIKFWSTARAARLDVCIDGGWAVDALLGRQTRPHDDLDIALPVSRVAALKDILFGQGFREVPRADSWEHNFVLDDGNGRIIDVHAYELNADGSNRFGVPYTADHLTGEGEILGTKIRCVPVHWLIRFHTGYELDETDWHDVRLLCQEFGIAIPSSYDRFRTGKSNA